MILYCDTSALVKLYFEEKHSADVSGLRRNAETVAISVVGYAEFLAALNRKRREGDLDAGAFRRVAARFQEDWEGLVRVEITDELNLLAASLLGSYPLRGFDALHLASALLLRERLRTREIQFASFDVRQRDAALQENLKVVPQSVTA